MINLLKIIDYLKLYSIQIIYKSKDDIIINNISSLSNSNKGDITFFHDKSFEFLKYKNDINELKELEKTSKKRHKIQSGKKGFVL